MTQIAPFEFEGNQVRTISAHEVIWFAMPDVADSLGLSNPTVAVKSLDRDEVTKFNLGSLSGNTNFISEPGLYKLIGASRKPAAKRFNRWVTHDVLPSIRKTGSYSTELKPQLSPELQFMQSVVDKLAATERNQQRLEGKIDSVSEIVATSTLDWRNETAHLISKVARQQGNTGEAFRNTRNDVYDEVDRRGGVSLKTRLTNLRRRMAEEGVSKTSRTNTTKVDVISHDKKLIEIYTAIVKEFAIKFQVWNEEY